MGVGEDPPYESLQGCRATLEAYLEKLDEAKSQISASADQCKTSVESAISSMMKQLESVLDGRKMKLLTDITEMKKKALAEAEEQRTQALEQLRQADQLIGCSQADAEDETLQSTLLEAAEDILPSLPPLSAISRVTFHFSAVPILAAAQQLGRIEASAVVGSVRTEPRPGAVLVSWAQDETTDEDEDSTIYQLQYCYGDANKLETPVYHTAYEGGDTLALVRRLQRDVTYSFRVGRQAAAAAEAWTDWSHPVPGSTSLPHYVGPQLRPGAALRVLVVEAGAGCSDEGLALLDGGEEVAKEGSLAVPGALFVSATGEVYVDGVRRQMRLPPLTVGSHVTFTTERRQKQGTTRVWLETDDKQVVYDWRAKSTDLWLAASFNEIGWKLMLE